MKKFLSLVLAMLICFSLVSCGVDLESDNFSENGSKIKDTSSTASQDVDKDDSKDISEDSSSTASQNGDKNDNIDNLTDSNPEKSSHGNEISEVSETDNELLVCELDLSDSENKQIKKVTFPKWCISAR